MNESTLGKMNKPASIDLKDFRFLNAFGYRLTADECANHLFAASDESIEIWSMADGLPDSVRNLLKKAIVNIINKWGVLPMDSQWYNIIDLSKVEKEANSLMVKSSTGTSDGKTAIGLSDDTRNFLAAAILKERKGEE